METEGYACGELETSLSLSELVLLLPLQNLRVEARESSHFLDGHYLLLRTQTDREGTFEKAEREGYLISVEGQQIQDLEVLCLAVSASLSTHGLKHRIELYDSQDACLRYIHWNWPEQPDRQV